jgi:CRISPR type III-A-associated RAMP protein Csm4
LRIGPDSGVRDRVDRIFHSDSLFSAVSQAMLHLDLLDEWLEATVRVGPPAVRFGSCFPYQGDTLLVPPPRTYWPPAASSKVRWKGARFVPISVVESLAAGQPLREDLWMVDGESECLLPQRTPTVPGPFRVTVRSNAAIDRTGEGVATHSSACMEFTAGCGLWTVAQFADEAARDRWTGPLTSAFRLLADSGIGGERSRGWGRMDAPQITSGNLPDLLLRRGHSSFPKAKESGYWLLSMFHPGLTDVIDWQRGDYAVATRGGRVESHSGWGQGKQLTRMVTEGSVLVSPEEPAGVASDVAPDGFAHPVYRAGFALTIPIPLRPVTRDAKPQVTVSTAPVIVTAGPLPVVEPVAEPAPEESTEEVLQSILDEISEGGPANEASIEPLIADVDAAPEASQDTSSEALPEPTDPEPAA